jgi:hypothetical protein
VSGHDRSSLLGVLFLLVYRKQSPSSNGDTGKCAATPLHKLDSLDSLEDRRRPDTLLMGLDALDPNDPQPLDGTASLRPVGRRVHARR